MGTEKKRRKLSDGSPQKIEQPAQKSQPSQAKEEKDQRRSLFVRSLPASVTTERLAEHFSQSYPVKHATVVLDPSTKISRGFGFVTFTDADDAHAAAEQLNNTLIDGRKIKVEVAESRHRDIEDGGKKGINITAEKLKAQREEQKQDAQPPRLIVRNLPWSIKEADDLAKLFLSFGKVKHAVVPKRGPRMQYGFGIVIIRGKKNAERALAGVNGKEVDGRILAVDWAVDKKTWEQIQQEETQKQAEDVAAESQADVDADVVENASDQASGDSGALGNGVALVDEEDELASTSDVELDQKSDQGPDDDAESESESSAGDLEEKSSSDETTVFVRNLPYEIDDDALKDHFRDFGPVRYARVVYDHETERSRGTAFVCFFNESDAKSCVRSAPKKQLIDDAGVDKKRRGEAMAHSVLQNEAEDPSGRYTIEGRVLQVSRALSKGDADRRADEASDKRLKRDGDKRKLYLLSEGTISASSKLYSRLGKAEIDVRESSAKQRQKLIKSNPNLGLSLTRLSIRNVPRHITSKDLKALARDAVVGFSKDAKDGIREPLSKEELKRGGDEMKEAEKRRKEKGVGIVRQSKIVFEGREGGKVQEGTGRSRGYGFIEYYTHRNALAGLRWLNGHLVKPKDGSQEKPKRLIVEFAIENAQVVQRRDEREKRILEGGRHNGEQIADKFGRGRPDSKKGKPQSKNLKQESKKRKRPSEEEKSKPVEPAPDQDDKNRLAKRNRIISKKRSMRKARKG